ncbi:hypothetical protein RclHR1_19220002 [Rhizophagus clarus]|uniref:Uncharacterized protein n=1 Tax=Rhizophagus clarus TaxID=94130 RepID=A0A2Z6QTC4_9GLOM|nr:hypothetical protein RclHR1_19220002 [Rhizophagus clarus]
MGTLLADSNKPYEKEITLASQLEVVSEKNTGHIDYAVKALEELICITEGKLYQVVTGFAQNLVQCESVLQINKKCKADTAFKEDFDYIYRIVTTATDWYFIFYASDCTSKNPLNI